MWKLASNLLWSPLQQAALSIPWLVTCSDASTFYSADTDQVRTLVLRNMNDYLEKREEIKNEDPFLSFTKNSFQKCYRMHAWPCDWAHILVQFLRMSYTAMWSGCAKSMWVRSYVVPLESDMVFHACGKSSPGKKLHHRALAMLCILNGGPLTCAPVWNQC